ncbi:glycosyltransferase [Bosea rubneri]|uniref:Glycosyltransferase n=1 Tax=Bosea rubneri TaxID=3075434 RepID=A0ABU3SGS0_9HYPH|nr:glycosyltransferase [Bosea sp. ZW T0_25]MDU0343983.1 glycosyltransferase [Bosea sp. ZW T0_25]
MRLAFVGQEEYFGCHVERDLDNLYNTKFFQLRFGATKQYYKELIEFNPDITIVFRGELMDAETLSDLNGTKIGYSTEPSPKIIEGRLEYTRDSLGRFKTVLGIFDKPYDYIFHYDEASRSFFESQGLFFSGYAPLPIATETYVPLPIERSRGILFFGRSTEHREGILGPLKRDFDVLHLAHGWPGGTAHEISEFNTFVARSRVVLNIHAEDEVSWEPRLQQCLSCGALVISEPISDNTYLTPDVHYLQASGGPAFYDLVRRVMENPSEFAGVARAGRQRVLQTLSSASWFPRFFQNLQQTGANRFALNSSMLSISELEIMLEFKGFSHLSTYMASRNA